MAKGMASDHDIDRDFAAWLGPHLPMLRRTARAFAAPRDQHDLLQELTVALWKAQPSFREQSAAGTFAHRVATTPPSPGDGARPGDDCAGCRSRPNC